MLHCCLCLVIFSSKNKNIIRKENSILIVEYCYLELFVSREWFCADLIVWRSFVSFFGILLFFLETSKSYGVMGECRTFSSKFDFWKTFLMFLRNLVLQKFYFDELISSWVLEWLNFHLSVIVVQILDILVLCVLKLWELGKYFKNLISQ